MGCLGVDLTRRPRRSAFDKAFLCTVDAIREEIDAVSQQRTGHGREVHVLQDLKVVVELLQTLCDMNVHRSAARQSVGRECLTDPGSPAFGQRRQCDSCAQAVCVWLSNLDISFSSKIELQGSSGSSDGGRAEAESRLSSISHSEG